MPSGAAVVFVKLQSFCTFSFLRDSTDTEARFGTLKPNIFPSHTTPSVRLLVTEQDAANKKNHA